MISETHLAIAERVEANTVIGFVGGTPYWAPHLHLSLLLSPSDWADNKIGDYPGNTVDPLNYMNIPISTQGTDWDVKYVHY
jgi:murein DD-endopeptidase MepM/ murein hydrolase activator NlpD